MALTVDIRDQATAALRKLTASISPSRIQPMVGAASVRLFQQNFLSRPANKMGFPSTGFWADAARSTNYRVQPDGVMVSVSKLGVRQRFQGGEIKPTGGRKYLTIPARAEAYGKRAREFHNLRIAFRRVGGRAEAYALVEAEASQVALGRKRKDGARSVTQGASVGGAVMFWLVKSVRQSSDPSVLPPDNLILAAALETIEDAIDREQRRATGGAA